MNTNVKYALLLTRATLIGSILFLYSSLAHAAYVPGMTCEEVGGFAQSVAEQKEMGETLHDQIVGLHQSLGDEDENTQVALEQIIRAIYKEKDLSNAKPESVGEVYKHSCELLN